MSTGAGRWQTFAAARCDLCAALFAAAAAAVAVAVAARRRRPNGAGLASRFRSLAPVRLHYSRWGNHKFAQTLRRRPSLELGDARRPFAQRSHRAARCKELRRPPPGCNANRPRAQLAPRTAPPPVGWAGRSLSAVGPRPAGCTRPRLALTLAPRAHAPFPLSLRRAKTTSASRNNEAPACARAKGRPSSVFN